MLPPVETSLDRLLLDAAFDWGLPFLPSDDPCREFFLPEGVAKSMSYASSTAWNDEPVLTPERCLWRSVLALAFQEAELPLGCDTDDELFIEQDQARPADDRAGDLDQAALARPERAHLGVPGRRRYR